MRSALAILTLCLLAAPVQAQEGGQDLGAPEVAPPSAADAGFTPALLAAHPPPDDPPRAVRSTDWEGPFSLSLGAALVYELGDWPSALLFGQSQTEAAPGVAAIVAVRHGLLDIFELYADLSLRYLYYGDLAADDSPSTPYAENVSVLIPSVALTARLRPGSRFYLGAGLGVGFGVLFGEAVDADGALVPFGDTSGAVGELRGEVGFLLGPKTNWDLGARLRFVGYPRVVGTATLAVALELALTVPVFP